MEMVVTSSMECSNHDSGYNQDHIRLLLVLWDLPSHSVVYLLYSTANILPLQEPQWHVRQQSYSERQLVCDIATVRSDFSTKRSNEPRLYHAWKEG